MFRDRGLFGRFKQGVGIDRVKEIRHDLVVFALGLFCIWPGKEWGKDR
jgi:hypothetical protein